MRKTVKLYYSSIANMGDRLNALIIERCFDLAVQRHSFLTGEMSAIGSGLSQYMLHGTRLMRLQQRINGILRPRVSVWGTGFINYDDCKGRFFKRKMSFCAVRGELTRRSLEAICGHSLDIPTGDAGILASRLLDKAPEKLYDVGIVPHLCDISDAGVQALLREYENCRLIDVRDDALEVVKQIAQCRIILSSSLHGLIVADSFCIPNMHVVFTDKLLGDGYKFDDYYSAYGLPHNYRDLRVETAPAMQDVINAYAISPEMLEDKKEKMLMSFPGRSAGCGKTN